MLGTKAGLPPETLQDLSCHLSSYEFEKWEPEGRVQDVSEALTLRFWGEQEKGCDDDRNRGAWGKAGC